MDGGVTGYSPRVRVGTPLPPDPSLYSHLLTEKERMLSGWPNNSFDETLYAERIHAQELCQAFNNNNSTASPREILMELLHPSCRDNKELRIKQPAQIEYGYGLKVQFVDFR
jgi:hypothetical protein